MMCAGGEKVHDDLIIERPLVSLLRVVHGSIPKQRSRARTGEALQK